MCWKCKNAVVETEITRNSQCTFCGSDLHSCKNCIYYSPGSHYDCHETVDELVKDKEKANFCDSFKIKKEFNNKQGDDMAKKAVDAFNALFG